MWPTSSRRCGHPLTSLPISQLRQIAMSLRTPVAFCAFCTALLIGAHGGRGILRTLHRLNDEHPWRARQVLSGESELRSDGTRVVRVAKVRIVDGDFELINTLQVAPIQQQPAAHAVARRGARICAARRTNLRGAAHDAGSSPRAAAAASAMRRRRY